ncbi:hypothetical protein BGZ46_001607, partial [Entomortierella lignicola]
GALAPSRALRANITLATLDLAHSLIGDKGALSLSNAFKCNTTLVTLYMNENRIENEGVLAFSEALKTNTILTRRIDKGQRSSQKCSSSVLL